MIHNTSDRFMSKNICTTHGKTTALHEKYTTIRCVDTSAKGSDIIALHYADNSATETQEDIDHKKKQISSNHSHMNTQRRIFQEYWLVNNTNKEEMNTNSSPATSYHGNDERPKRRRLFPSTIAAPPDNHRNLFQRHRSTPTLPVTLLQRPPLKKAARSTSALLKSKSRHNCQRLEVSFDSKVYIYEYTIPLELMEADATWEDYFHWVAVLAIFDARQPLQLIKSCSSYYLICQDTYIARICLPALHYLITTYTHEPMMRSQLPLLNLKLRSGYNSLNIRTFIFY